MNNNQAIEIKPINLQLFEIKIKGETNLIFNRFDEKSAEAIREKQVGKRLTNPRIPKDPQALGEATFYKNSKGEICIPTKYIRGALIAAIRNVPGLTMAAMKGTIFVKAPEGLIPASYKHKQIREDKVRIGAGQTDLRYRGEIIDWSATFLIEYNASVITADQVVNLLQLAGFSCGLGDWRPNKGGEYGAFKVTV